MDVGTVLAVAVGGVFLYAASFKVLDASPMRRTLSELGVPRPLATFGARLVPVAELTVALGVLGPTPAPVKAALVALAATVIGAVGLTAVRRRTPVRCSCFSALSTNVLGPRQMFAAGSLMPAAVGLLVFVPRHSADGALLQVVAGGCIVAAAHAATLMPYLRVARRNRRAMASVYPA